jgi:hypothetical protein
MNFSKSKKTELDSAVEKLGKEKVDYEQNLAKLKAFHERELDALKQNSTSEYQTLLNNLKLELEKANKSKIQIEQELTRNYNAKLEEIVAKEAEISQLQDELNKLKFDHSNINKQLGHLNLELADLGGHKQSLESKLNELMIEKMALMERCDSQSHQLVDKSGLISKLEAENMQKTSMINDLTAELGIVRERLNLLEDDRRSLENANLSLNERQTKLIKGLEDKIEALNSEKDSQLKQLHEKIRETVQMSENEIKSLKEMHTNQLEGLANDHEAKLAQERDLFEQKMLQLQNELSKGFNSESQKLLQQQMETKILLDKTVDELKSKTRSFEVELKGKYFVRLEGHFYEGLSMFHVFVQIDFFLRNKIINKSQLYNFVSFDLFSNLKFS